MTVLAQSDKELVLETVKKNVIEGHIYFLADDVLKGRATGSPELKIAASYLANSFRRYGVQPNPKTGTYYQEVKLKHVSPPKNASIEINNQVITDYAFINAAAWVGIEWLRGWVFTGFGWNGLGVAFHETPVLAQATDLPHALALATDPPIDPAQAIVDPVPATTGPARFRAWSPIRSAPAEEAIAREQETTDPAMPTTVRDSPTIAPPAAPARKTTVPAEIATTSATRATSTTIALTMSTSTT